MIVAATWSKQGLNYWLERETGLYPVTTLIDLLSPELDRSSRVFLFMPQAIQEMGVMPKKKDKNAMTLHYIDRLSFPLTKRNCRKYVRRE